MGIRGWGSGFATCGLWLVASVGTASLVAITVVGPVSLASISGRWAIAFLATLLATVVWWSAYLALLGKLAGRPWQLGLRRSRWLLALLSTSSLLSLPVFLSGKLPYTLVFDPATRSLYLWLSATLLLAVVVGQEVTLLLAVRDEGPGPLAKTAWRRFVALPRGLARLPGVVVRQTRSHPIQVAALLALLAVAAGLRLAELNVYHQGDMGVLLSVSYATLSWPPFGYYHAYRPQTYVYNHMPFFPMLLAPFYWWFENVWRLPTVWAAKLLIGAADLVVAGMIFSQPRGRWRGIWGLALAAVWLLAPWVIGADDHPVAVAVAFAIGAFATLQRGWLAGILLALGMATRNEVAFFVLPLAVHFATRRGLGQTMVFLGAFGTTLALVVGPFVLSDPEALDFAIRRHTEQFASNQTSPLTGFITPLVGQDVSEFLHQKPEVPAIVANLLVALLAARDRRPIRVGVAAFAGYLLALPVVHPRYTLFLFAPALFYAARHGNPIVAALALAAVWPGFDYALPALLALSAGLILHPPSPNRCVEASRPSASGRCGYHRSASSSAPAQPDRPEPSR